MKKNQVFLHCFNSVVFSKLDKIIYACSEANKSSHKVTVSEQYQGSNCRSFIHKCLINSNILVNSWTLMVRIHTDTLDVTYQFIIKLRNKILFAKHNVCLSLKKLQHMINCHLHRKQIFSNTEALRAISDWVKRWAMQMCTVRRLSFISTSSIHECEVLQTHNESAHDVNTVAVLNEFNYNRREYPCGGVWPLIAIQQLPQCWTVLVGIYSMHTT